MEPFFTDETLTGLQQAFLTIQKLKAKLQANEQAEKEPIAIIGLSCRFPGKVNSPQAFWELLLNGIDAISETPPDKNYTRYGGLLEDIELFDAAFFGISPREAESLDPQQRLLLEVSWEALEYAGCNPMDLAGEAVGVFIGMGQADFGIKQMLGNNKDNIDAYQASGSVQAFGAGRIAYFLGLQGPVLTLDTACSSSLVTVHLACQSLRNGESRMALAGGVQINLLAETNRLLTRTGALSPEGRCKTFDASANGYVRSEGCGMVVLKKYRDALAAGDNILAVIRGSAVNHDGASSGLTVPNGRAQEQVIKKALTNAAIKPAEVSYIETHGTGTVLGDPIEVEALANVYGQNRVAPLWLGAVKTNIGHTEAASGIAGLIKVVLAVQHKQLPKNLHFDAPNPHIPWSAIPIAVVKENTNWTPNENCERIAGISAFGMSGTNAHLIVADIAAQEKVNNNTIANTTHCFTLAAKTFFSLQKLVKNYLHHLTQHPELNVADICYTTNIGRAHFPCRLALCVQSTVELLEQLDTFVQKPETDTSHNDVASATLPKIVFLCKEFSEKLLAHSKHFYISQAIFRQAIEQCDAIIKPWLQLSFATILTTEQTTLEFKELCCFILQYAQIELWRAWGIYPDLVIGEGSGQTTANYVAGLFTLEETLHALIQSTQQNRQPVAAQAKIPLIEVAASLSALNNLANPYLIEIGAQTQSNEADFIQCLAELYKKGFTINWQNFHKNQLYKKIPLPTYCFERKRYWPVAEQADTQFSINLPTANLGDFTLAYLRKIFSEVLKIPMAELDSHKTYEVFGMDSLVGREIIARLDADLGNINQTLLFEYNRLIDLSAYLQEQHYAALIALQQKAASVQANKPLHASQHKNNSTSMPANFTEKVTDTNGPIAIIGLSGKYPLADDLTRFWENLIAGRDCITDLPNNRWQAEAYALNNNTGTHTYKRGGFVDDVDKFDPLFFGVSPTEASIILDPQERLFLQTAWATFEDAGYTREKFAQVAQNKVGVYVGVTYHYYPLYIAEEWAKGNRLPLTIQFYTLANRLSYFMNFTGPSMPVDTACSSALAAIHLACESIRRGECIMALAGGVNLSLHPAKYFTLGLAGFMSEQGRCASFAEGGNGYIPGEGVGAVLLKPLALAMQDGDQIYGVIRSSAMNHDGKTSGFTVPNPKAQAQLIIEAINKAGVNPRTISYIEAHGTGTALGDPIEIKGLQDAFAHYTDAKQFCAIGSVKSNIGHLEAAAGISQLTKVLLQFKHQMLVPSIHTDTLNPYINFAETPFYVQRQLASWQTEENNPRRAGISSFGAGGVNVHLIVEEYLQQNTQTATCNPPFAFVLSAQTLELLHDYIKGFISYLQSAQAKTPDSQEWLANICYTLQTGREAMPIRLGLIIYDMEELIKELQQLIQQPDMLLSSNVNKIEILHDSTAKFNSNNPKDLIEQWLRGHVVAWEALYDAIKPKCISLPTYPFAKRRCWVPGQPYFNDEQQTYTVDNQDWFYSQGWEQQSLAATNMELSDGYCVILADAEINKITAEHLNQSRIIYCVFANEYKEVDAKHFCISRDNLEDYKKLFHRLSEENTLPEKIIYINFNESIGTGSNATDLWQLSHTAEYTQQWLIFIQALMAFTWTVKPQLYLITQGAQQVLPTDPINIWQHPLKALIGVLAIEQPEFKPKLIDLDATQSFAQQITVLKTLWQNTLTADYAALRAGNYYVAYLQPNAEKLETQTWSAPQAALVTGGLGALGFEVANWLAMQGTRYLLLVGNTRLPPREEWQSVTEPNLKIKINYLQALESSNIHVHYAAIDVADQPSMAKIIHAVEKKWLQNINGVFHLAGITTDSITLEQTSINLLKAVLKPKVQGTLALHELFKHRTLNCFVMFSSSSAVPYFSSHGLVAYSAANAFMDGFAYYRRSLGLTALTVNWTAWTEKGMSFNYKQDALLSLLGLTSLTIQDGLTLLKQLLASDCNNKIVLKVDWQKFLAINPKLNALAYFAKVTPIKSPAKAIVGQYYSQAEIMGLLIDCLANLLSMQKEELDIAAPLQNYGLDSITGLNFITQLAQVLPNPLSPTDLYRYVTIQQLADYIYSQQALTNSVKPDGEVTQACAIELSGQIKKDPIAIVGLSCRFPQAANKHAFWQLLASKQNAVTKLPKERLQLLKGSREEDLLDPQQPYWSAYLTDVELFDASFFGITPREALYMDPQQRLLLEAAYEAFEDAGLTLPSLINSNTGVYVGMYASQYLHFCESADELDALYLSTGNANSIAANRLSYLFDLRGPSLTVDTACSSSLTALHLAVEHLHNERCKQALVAGVSLNLLPSINAVLTRAKMLAPDGQCKTFDASANGYVPGEGVAAVILKPLSKALADQDRIYAVIANAAINQDGKTNGLTAPNGAQQEALLKTAYTESHSDPAQISYIECHGTGTFLGDPIEVEALGNIIGVQHNTEQPCWLGSVKTNIGHLEPAAGMASLIKICLALQEGKIPAHLNFNTANPHIPFAHYHFKIPQALQDWPRYGECRMAGISSFGFGGSNAHVIVRELLPNERKADWQSKEFTNELFTLSAKHPDALIQLIATWLQYLNQHQTTSLASLCYNLHTRRSHFSYRLAIIASDLDDLQIKLQASLQQRAMYGVSTNLIKTNTDNVDTSEVVLDLAEPELIAQLYIKGSTIDWGQLEQNRHYPVVDLPLYCWQHKSYWPQSKNTTVVSETNKLIPCQLIHSPLAEQQFEFIFSHQQLPELKDTNNILHVGFYLEMLAYAVQIITGKNQFIVEDLEFLMPIYIPPNTSIKVQLIIQTAEADKKIFSVYQYDADKTSAWTLHAKGYLICNVSKQIENKDIAQIQQQCSQDSGNAEHFAARIKAMHMPIANTIQWTNEYWQGKQEVIAKYRLPLVSERANGFSLQLHPGIMDGSIQPLFLLLDKTIKLPYITTKIERFYYFGNGQHPLYLSANLQDHQQNAQQIAGNWYLLNEDNTPVAVAINIQLKQLGAQVSDSEEQALVRLKKSLDKFNLADYAPDERYVHLVNFLCEQVAILFKMPLNEINSQQSLQEMGMDSLLAIALAKCIEESTGMSYPLAQLLKPINIQQIAKYLSGAKTANLADENVVLDFRAVDNSNTWIVYRQKKPAASLKLICFPYGGGGASIYREWGKFLPDNIEVCPIQLPGRENRLQEQPITHLNQLIEILAAALSKEMTAPYALFGHSFGALIAFELTRYLVKYKLDLPSHLFVSAFPAPHLSIANFEKLLKQVNQWSLASEPINFNQLSDDKIREISTVLQSYHLHEDAAMFNTALLRHTLPIMLMDSQLVASYNYIAGKPLPMPITAFYSCEDKWIEAAHINDWRQHTQAEFNIHQLSGGHIFIKDEPVLRQLLAILQTTLSKEMLIV